MSDSTAPPPTYGTAVGDPYMQPGQASAPVITEPPPKYEAPKDGPYAQQPPPVGYPPIQPQGAYPAGV